VGEHDKTLGTLEERSPPRQDFEPGTSARPGLGATPASLPGARFQQMSGQGRGWKANSTKTAAGSKPVGGCWC
jgi:hypothetical protein